MNYDRIGDWYSHEEKIRSRTVEYKDPEWGDKCLDYEFQVFKRPYLWGLVGHKKWIWSITTNNTDMGFGFSKSLLKNN